MRDQVLRLETRGSRVSKTWCAALFNMRGLRGLEPQPELACFVGYA
jgi:hypothetical protein